jgi:hypothetical protein
VSYMSAWSHALVCGASVCGPHLQHNNSEGTMHTVSYMSAWSHALVCGASVCWPHLQGQQAEKGTL